MLDITVVGVHPNFRMKGLGRKVLLSLINKAKDYKADNAILEVRKDNLAALGLYTSLDFKKVYERKKYYRDDSSALVLARTL